MLDIFLIYVYYFQDFIRYMICILDTISGNIIICYCSKHEEPIQIKDMLSYNFSIEMLPILMQYQFNQVLTILIKIIIKDCILFTNLSIF
jgi:hypothetical protein